MRAAEEASARGHAESGAWTPTARYAVVALGLMFSLPLVQPRHTNPITSFYSEWLAFVLGSAALLVLVFRGRASPLKWPMVATTPLLLAAVVVGHLLALTSAYPQQPLLAIGYLIWAALLAVTAAELRAQLGLGRLSGVLAGFLLAGGLANTLAAVLQHYEWRGPFEAVIATKLGFQVYGNLGQPNHFATHVTLALASLGLLFSTRRISGIWTVAATAPMLFVLSLSGSRSTWVYVPVVAVVACAGYWKARTATARRGLVFGLALIPGLVLAHFVAQLPWLQPPTLHTTTIDRMFALAGTTSERLQLWREAWAMFTSAPLFGIGWGEFGWRHFMLAGNDGRALTGLYNHAHNLVLQLLAETGLVGAGIVIVGMVAWVRNAAAVSREPAGLWIWACVLVLGVHSMLEYPLWNAYFLGIAAVLLAMGEGHTVSLRRADLLRAGAAGFAFVCAWASVSTLHSYYRLERVVHAQYTRGDKATLQHAHREMLDVGSSFFLAPYVELAYARDIDLGNALLESKLAFTTRVMRFAPTGLVAYRHAALKALHGDEAEARIVLRQAVRCYPQVLDGFTREFASAATGDPRAQQQFLAELRRMEPEADQTKVTLSK